MPLFDEWGLLPEGKEHSHGGMLPGVRHHEDRERVVASGIMVCDGLMPTPKLWLHAGPGLVITTGRQSKASPPLPSLARGLPSFVRGRPAPGAWGSGEEEVDGH